MDPEGEIAVEFWASRRKMTASTDLAQKIEMRRAICSLMPGPLRVLDLYSGTGAIWESLREWFELETYTPVDKNPQMLGVIRMKVDERTVKAFDMSRFNVVDLDCYGEPWRVWDSIHASLQPGTAAFLTYGHLATGHGGISHWLLETSGIPVDEWGDIPTNQELSRFLGKRFLFKTLADRQVRKAISLEFKHMTYYGILL